LRTALGDPFRDDRSLSCYAVALDETDRARVGRTPRRRDPKFLARADAFLAALEIGLRFQDARARREGGSPAPHRAAALFDVESIARGHVRTVGGLKYLEQAFFTEWNEGPPRETNAFWREVAKASLPFVRRDLFAEIFERGRIGSREHYEFAVDVIGCALDEGLLDAPRSPRCPG